MNEADRSSILYLLDAIRVAPEKTPRLLGIVSKKLHKRSNYFCELIDEIQNSADVLSTADSIRERLR